MRIGATALAGPLAAPLAMRQRYHPAAVSLFAAMDVAPDRMRRGLIDSTISRLVTAGVWAKLDDFAMLAAHDAQAARVGWKSLTEMTATNAPTFETDRGYTGNGTSSYIDTGFNPATANGQLALNSGHIGVWSRTDGASNNSDFGNANNRLFVRTALGAMSARMMVAVSPAGTVNVADGLGHSSASRVAAEAYTYYKDGVSIGDVTQTAAALASVNFWIGASNGGTYSTRQIACAHWGAGLTAAENAALYAAVRSYLAAIGAAS